MPLPTRTHMLHACYKANQNITAMPSKWVNSAKDEYCHLLLSLCSLSLSLVALDDQMAARVMNVLIYHPPPLLQLFDLSKVACSLSPIDLCLCRSITRFFNLSYMALCSTVQLVIFYATHVVLSPNRSNALTINRTIGFC